jgi:hypothetical protein
MVCDTKPVRIRHIGLGTVDIPKTIHVLVVIACPTLQDTLSDTTPKGERTNATTNSSLRQLYTVRVSWIHTWIYL